MSSTLLAVAVRPTLASQAEQPQTDYAFRLFYMASLSSALPASIVVVDPHADNRAMYRELLEGAGWHASVVATGRDALVCLGGDPRPRAVVFDVVLPDMSGLAFSEAMEALLGEGIPCKRIVVTGWLLSAADRAALTSHGITAIYSKPCDLEALLRALNS